MELEVLGRFFAALLFVLALIGLIAWVFRRTGLLKGALFAGRGGGAGSLKVVEQMALDTRRRLVVIEHADRRHLLLLGQNGDLVIESAPAEEDRPRTETGK